MPQELSEFLERLWADVVFDPLGIDFRDFGRDIQRQEKVEYELVSFCATDRKPFSFGCQFEWSVGDGLDQPEADQPIDDSQGRYVGDAKATSQIGIAALSLGGDEFSDRLDIIFRLFAGMVFADPVVGRLRGVRSAWFARQFGNSQKLTGL